MTIELGVTVDQSFAKFNPASTRCLICGSQRLSRFEANAFDVPSGASVHIVECCACNFAWQYPLARSEDQSIGYFDAAHMNKANDSSSYFHPEKKSRIAELELEFVESLPVKGRCLLDIGAGSGSFARTAASNGWDVTALDPALQISGLSDIERLEAIRGTTAELGEGRTFDVVTMWDVIEHVVNPLEFVMDALPFVNAAGWLVMETGNYKCAERLHETPNHWIYQSDHRWYFAPDSLETLLKVAGLQMFRYADRPLLPNWVGQTDHAVPTLSRTARRILKDVAHTGGHVKRYLQSHRARRWRMSGHSVICIAARRNGLSGARSH